MKHVIPKPPGILIRQFLKRRGSLVRVLAALLVTVAVPHAAAGSTSNPAFLSPHSNPIVVNEGWLYVVNTPAGTIDVLDTGSLAIVARVVVGIDPVSLALRPDGRELWVSNHVSDSVSVIDTDPASPAFLQIVATVQDFDPETRATRFDEPVGIAFAGNEKAYVALSSENRIAVVNVTTRQVDRFLDIPAQDPRAIAVRGGRLYVIPFESNNQTQISGCTGQLGSELCTFDAVEHVVDNNNVLSRFAIVDIVRHPGVPDRDLFIFDTSTDQLVEEVDTLGTLLYGLAVDSAGRVFIAQTDARNDVNGKAGTRGDGLQQLDNRAFLNRITRVDCAPSCSSPVFYDLEPLPPQNPGPGQALATPFGIAVSEDDSTLVATAAGSDMLFIVDASSGELLGRTGLDSVPRGITLEFDAAGRPLRAWVLNAVSNSVSRVDLEDRSNPRVTDTIALEDPTPPVVKRGRAVFNDANASTTGTFSCESCHPDGGTDQLLWVLETPPCNIAGCDQIPPRITMPIRGLRETAPYHWDGIPGDPYGGRNTANINSSSPPNCSRTDPDSCTRNLVDGSLATTLCQVGQCPVNDEGKKGALTAAQRDDLAAFLLSVPYPPAQRRAYTNIPSSRAKEGFRLFHIEGDLQGNPEPNVCGDCHRMPFWVSTNTPGTGMEAPTWRGAYDRWLILPQGRLNIIDFDFFRSIAQKGIPERDLWRLSWSGRSRFDPVWDMVLEGSTGFSGAFGRQVTLSQQSVEAPLTADLLDALEQAAKGGAVLLQAEGFFLHEKTPRPVRLQYDRYRPQSPWADRDHDDTAWSRSQLMAMAAEGVFTGTMTARLGTRAGPDDPQPAIWSPGPIEAQRGRQQFPTLIGDNTRLDVSGRHVREGARVYVDGRRVPGYAVCRQGELPDCTGEALEVELPFLPLPSGVYLLQLQNPDGLFSNEFIIFSNSLGDDNCPNIPNPEQQDSDGDGIGDRCDDDAFNYEIHPGISGSWYDPEHNGEGWLVELLDEKLALVYWFTHTPPAVGDEHAQAWIGGLGEIRGSSIVVPSADSFITTGPPFGPDFDPGRVEIRTWGKFVLSFSDCDNGIMYYQSDDPDYGNGSLDLKRLTQIEGLGCEGSLSPDPATNEEEPFRVTPALSGSWFDPSHDGEGGALEILDSGAALLAWFSYDPEGNQAWFYHTGEVAGDTIRFELLIPQGPDFGPTFDPDELELPPWGSMTLKFSDCHSASLSYDSPVEGYGSGSLQLQRLTSLWGLDCS